MKTFAVFYSQVVYKVKVMIHPSGRRDSSQMFIQQNLIRKFCTEFLKQTKNAAAHQQSYLTAAIIHIAITTQTKIVNTFNKSLLSQLLFLFVVNEFVFYTIFVSKEICHLYT